MRLKHFFLTAAAVIILLLVLSFCRVTRSKLAAPDHSMVGSRPGAVGSRPGASTADDIFNDADATPENAAAHAAEAAIYGGHEAKGGVGAAPTAGLDSAVKTSQHSLWCDIIGRLASREECASYRQAVEHLDTGLAAFNPPTVMKQGETRLVQLAISRDPAQTSPVDAISSANGKIITLSVKAGSMMAATLAGFGMRVEPKSQTEQALGASALAEWDWEVTALPATSHSLKLTTYVDIPDDSSGPRKHAWTRVKTYDVDVEVSKVDRLRAMMDQSGEWLSKTTNLLKALAGAILAASGVWLAIRTFGKRKNSGGSDTNSD